MMPVLFLLAAAVLWGVIGVVSKFAFAAGISPLEVAFWRGLIGGTCFILHAFADKTAFELKRKITFKDFRLIILFSILGVAGLESMNLITVNLAGAGFGAIMLYTAPVWVAIMSRIIFKESFGLLKVISLIVTLIGVAGVSLASSGGFEVSKINTIAVITGLISSVSYALFYIFGKAFFGKYSPRAVYGIAFPFASLAILPFVQFSTKPVFVWAILLFNGVASTYLAYLCYTIGLKSVNATKAAIITSLEPVIAAFFAWIFWKESLGLIGYASAIVVFAGIALVLISDHSGERS